MMVEPHAASPRGSTEPVVELGSPPVGVRGLALRCREELVGLARRADVAEAESLGVVEHLLEVVSELRDADVTADALELVLLEQRANVLRARNRRRRWRRIRDVRVRGRVAGELDLLVTDLRQLLEDLLEAERRNPVTQREQLDADPVLRQQAVAAPVVAVAGLSVGRQCGGRPQRDPGGRTGGGAEEAPSIELPSVLASRSPPPFTYENLTSWASALALKKPSP